MPAPWEAKEWVQKDAQSLAQSLEMVSTYAFLLGAGYPSQESITKTLKLKPHLSHLRMRASITLNGE